MNNDGDNGIVTRTKTRQRIAGAAWLAVVLLPALLVRFHGIEWPRGNHPDELTIHRMAARLTTHATLRRIYPQGFFQLFVPFREGAAARERLGHRWRYWTGAANRTEPPRLDFLMLCRYFNVWLGALSALVVALLARRITGSRAAGMCAGLLFAFAQLHVEHSHYAETDIAMVFMLALALLFWARAADDNSRALNFAAAAALSGFAAGTKFTLVGLALLIPVHALAFSRARPLPRRIRRLLGAIAAGLVLFVIGFAVSNPRFLHLRKFMEGAARAGHSVYAETRGVMGEAGTGWKAMFFSHLRTWRISALTLGWGWAALAAAGLPCAFHPRYRRYGIVLIVFPAVYTYYYLFKAPWVRTQEFLNYLPCAAVLAVLPLALAWRLRPAAAARRTVRLAALTAAGAAVLHAAINGVGVASLFGWTDTRDLAEQWLTRHLPPGRRAGTELYTGAAGGSHFAESEYLYKIERSGIDYARRAGSDYVVRNAGARGRGIFDLRTGNRYPGYQARFDAFVAQTEKLCVWDALPPQGVRATFASPRVELYGMRRFPDAEAFDLTLPRPAWISAEGRETDFPSGRTLGARRVVRIDDFPQEIALGGPGPFSRTPWLMLYTRERPATVNVRAFGRRRTFHVPPYSLHAYRLQRPPWRPRFGKFETIRLSTVLQRHQAYLPCYAGIAFGAAEVAARALDLGYEDQIPKQVPLAEIAAEDPVAAYRVAVRSGNPDFADRLRPAVLEVFDRLLERMPVADASNLRINGINGFYFEEFARVEFPQPQTLLHTRIDDPVPFRNRDGSQQEGYRSTFVFPALLPPGAYVLQCALQARDPDPQSRFQLTDGTGRIFASGYWSDTVSDPTLLHLPFETAFHVQPELTVVSDRRLYAQCRAIGVTWNLQDTLRALLSDLSAALSEHDLESGRLADVRRRLSDPRLPPDPAAQRLRLALLNAQGSDASVAARAVLSAAGHHFEALRALAPHDESVRRETDARRPNLARAVAFGPFLDLVAFRNMGKEMHLVFAVRRSGTPPLKAVLWQQRRGRWRKHAETRIAGTGSTTAGEHLPVILKSNALAAGTEDRDAWAVGVKSDVEWFPGILSANGDPRGRVRLSTLHAAILPPGAEPAAGKRPPTTTGTRQP